MWHEIIVGLEVIFIYISILFNPPLQTSQQHLNHFTLNKTIVLLYPISSVKGRVVIYEQMDALSPIKFGRLFVFVFCFCDKMCNLVQDNLRRFLLLFFSLVKKLFYLVPLGPVCVCVNKLNELNNRFHNLNKTTINMRDFSFCHFFIFSFLSRWLIS